MSIFPTDWSSFLWGLTIGALGVFFSGFLKKLGEESWLVLKKRLFPEPPEPIQVAKNFDPVLFAVGDCVWVTELRKHDKEMEGYTYYPHPQGNAKCFRVVGSENGIPKKEFLMAKPEAKPRGA